MKKTIAFCLSALMLAVLLCGCGGKKTAVVPLTKGISFTADIKYYNEILSNPFPLNTEYV